MCCLKCVGVPVKAYIRILLLSFISHLHQYILHNDNAQLSHNETNNTQDAKLWLECESHTLVELKFQLQFSTNIRCGVSLLTHPLQGMAER
jgi:hypothetical protein